MFVVGTGNSSGTVLRRLVHDDFAVMLTRHTVEECATGLHFHERPHLSLVLKGGDLELRGTVRSRREPGTLGFYDAGEVHASLSREGKSLHASVELAPPFLAQLGVSSGEVADAVRSRVDAPLVVLRTLSELERDDATSPIALETMITDLVTTTAEPGSHRTPAWVHAVRALLHEAWAEPLTLAMLARHAGVHPITVSKNFRRYFGTTLSTYLRQLRLRRSLPMVATDAERLSGVAFRCGFADQSHFTRAFRQQTGFSPGALRRFPRTDTAGQGR